MNNVKMPDTNILKIIKDITGKDITKDIGEKIGEKIGGESGKQIGGYIGGRLTKDPDSFIVY